MDSASREHTSNPVTETILYRCAFFFSSRGRHTRCLSDWSSACALPILSLVSFDLFFIDHFRFLNCWMIVRNLSTIHRCQGISLKPLLIESETQLFPFWSIGGGTSL